METPLRFVPFLRPMVWGGQRLGQLLHKPIVPGERFGESWDVSDHPLHRSKVARGPRTGQTLRSLMEAEAAGLIGAEAAADRQFPWLVKFLDACDWLSVQVHPDTAAVRQLWPGEGSKTEAWFVIDAAPGSRVYAGLLPGVDSGRLRDGLARGTVADCLHSFEPTPGDCIFLPAGTVHAVGGGVLIAEVQQTSDATFRLFDWNRRDAQGKSRTLHIEESLASIHWDKGPVHPVHVASFRSALDSPSLVRQQLVNSPFFVLDYLQSAEAFPCGGEGRLQALLVLEGEARLLAPGLEEEIALGQVWVFPAAMRPSWCQPKRPVKALLCTLP
jgi:mannose-6-phosphate isomerase